MVWVSRPWIRYLYYRLLGDDFKVSVVADKKDSLGRVYGIFGPNMPCDVLISEFYQDTENGSMIVICL